MAQSSTAVSIGWRSADALCVFPPAWSTSTSSVCSLTVGGMARTGTWDGTSIGDGSTGGLGSTTSGTNGGEAVRTTSKDCNHTSGLRVRFERRIDSLSSMSVQYAKENDFRMETLTSMSGSGGEGTISPVFTDPFVPSGDNSSNRHPTSHDARGPTKSPGEPDVKSSPMK